MANINDAFPSNYLKASDLKGRSVVVQIDRVEFEPVGQTKEMKPIIYFAGKEKGLVLNKTNAKQILNITGYEDTDDWTGTNITIYPTETSFQGEMVDCIRVKRAAPNGNGRRAAQPPPPVEEEPEPIIDDDIPF